MDRLNQELLTTSRSLQYPFHTSTEASENKPALLFCHGFPYDSFLWNDVIEHLTETGILSERKALCPICQAMVVPRSPSERHCTTMQEWQITSTRSSSQKTSQESLSSAMTGGRYSTTFSRIPSRTSGQNCLVEYRLPPYIET